MQEIIEKSYINYDETIRACEIVKKNIIENDLVIYGGMAINYALMERGSKIYESWEMPDYDFYSSDNVNITYKIYNDMLDAGFDRVSCMSAIHMGTMKVRVGIEMVSDASYMDPKVLDFMKKFAGKFNGILYRNVYLQMADIHKVLAIPCEEFPSFNVNQRWKKDFGRLLMLIDKYKADDFDVGEEPKITGIKYKLKPNVLYIGDVAFNYYMSLVDFDARPVRYVSYICDEETYVKFKADEEYENSILRAHHKRAKDIELILPLREIIVKNGYCHIGYLIMYYYQQLLRNVKNGVETDTIHRYKDLLRVAEIVYPNYSKYPEFIADPKTTFGTTRPDNFEIIKMDDPKRAKEMIPGSYNYDSKYNNLKISYAEIK